MADNKIALVTGATGYAASHIIKVLTEKGYHVRGTMRNKAKAEQLLKLFPKLEVMEADLLKEGSFDDAVKGCTYVFHTASPFPLGEVVDAQKELVDPALKGTLNVLHSVAKDGNVKRVVLTSSVAAVAAKSMPVDHVFNEDDWNRESTVSFEPYRYSKRIAEETAWNFTKEKGISLVVICPSFIVGPPLLPNADATSVKKAISFFDGKFDQACFGAVDVRDIAEAHVRAAENPSASGRYLVTSPEAISNFELSQFIRNSGKFDQYNLPKENPTPVTIRLKYSNEKVKRELGLQLTPIDKAMVDMANALIELGLVQKK